MNSKLNLLAFEPDPSFEVDLHCVAMPEPLKAALLRLFPPQGSNGVLEQRYLKYDLSGWYDGFAGISPVKPDAPAPRQWVVSASPANTRRLRAVLSNWLEASCAYRTLDHAAAQAYSEARGLLSDPSLFDGCVGELGAYRPFASEGPASGDLPYAVGPLMLARRVSDAPLVLEGGRRLAMHPVLAGPGKGCGLLSDVMWHRSGDVEDPWSLSLQLRLETLPEGGNRLVLGLSRTAFVRGLYAPEGGFLSSRNVHARVSDGRGNFRVVRYGYRGDAGYQWNYRDMCHYRDSGFTELPDMADYLLSMDSFARDAAAPQILSPYSTFTTGALIPRVGKGVSFSDRAELYMALSERFEGIAAPLAPLSRRSFKSIGFVVEEPGGACGPDPAGHGPAHPEECEAAGGMAQAALHGEPACLSEASGECELASANRRRLAQCTGVDEMRIHLIGTRGDSELLQELERELERVLGAGDSGPLRLSVSTVAEDGLFKGLACTEDSARGDISAQERVKWGDVERRMRSVLGGQASGLEACLVAIPGRKPRPGASGYEAWEDPKDAIRAGLARTGRLTQFIESSGDSVEHRVTAAVGDLLRQAGFIRPIKERRAKAASELPAVYGISLFRNGLGRMRMEFPILVKVDVAGGLVTARCPVAGMEELPYWEFLLELSRRFTSAKVGWRKGMDGSLRPSMAIAGANDGRATEDLLRRVVAESMGAKALLTVCAQGMIRTAGWWPGISNASLSRGAFSLGPSRSPMPGCDGSLGIVRIRSSADGEVPGYFTDRSQGGTMKGASGIFLEGDHAYALVSRPNDPRYRNAERSSAFSEPGRDFAGKSLNEYCMMTPHSQDELLDAVTLCEALRKGAIQSKNPDMVPNLPMPLHLAELAGEYVWLPRVPKGRS